MMYAPISVYYVRKTLPQIWSESADLSLAERIGKLFAKDHFWTWIFSTNKCEKFADRIVEVLTKEAEDYDTADKILLFLQDFYLGSPPKNIYGYDKLTDYQERWQFAINQLQARAKKVTYQATCPQIPSECDVNDIFRRASMNFFMWLTKTKRMNVKGNDQDTIDAKFLQLKRNFRTLFAKEAMLDGMVIDHILEKVSKKQNLYVFPVDFFVSKVMTKLYLKEELSQDLVKKIFSENCLIPILRSEHYFLLHVQHSPDKMQVSIYDSLARHDKRPVIDALRQLLPRYRKGATFIERHISAPQQMNLIDCGYFLLWFAMQILQDASKIPLYAELAGKRTYFNIDTIRERAQLLLADYPVTDLQPPVPPAFM